MRQFLAAFYFNSSDLCPSPLSGALSQLVGVSLPVTSSPTPSWVFSWSEGIGSPLGGCFGGRCAHTLGLLLLPTCKPSPCQPLWFFLILETPYFSHQITRHPLSFHPFAGKRDPLCRRGAVGVLPSQCWGLNLGVFTARSSRDLPVLAAPGSSAPPAPAPARLPPCFSRPPGDPRLLGLFFLQSPAQPLRCFSPQP